LVRSASTAAEDPLNTVVILGSTRKKRIGSSVGQWLVDQLEERGHEVTVLDPRETHDGFYMTLMEKAMFHYKEGEEIPAALQETAQCLRKADCYVVCSPEYNHSLPPGLTNLMNYFGSKTYS
jgi:NAD(P)H-dependent FMN reductase